jgi:hypothetical protein
MGILDILWNLHQEGSLWANEAQLKSTDRTVTSQGQTLDTHGSQLAGAVAQLDHLNLVALALWELVGERLGLTVEQLRAKVEEIDLRDGVRDGRYTGGTPRCAGCGREVAPWRRQCMYCGQPRGAGGGLADVAGAGGTPAT